MLYERRHTRLIEDFGGVAHVLPIYATFFMIIALSSIGLPGTNGFVGEFLIILGTFKSNVTYAVLAASGVIIAAVYMLWMYQRVFFGQVTNPVNQNLRDLNFREKFILVPLVLLIFWIGLYPKPFLSRMETSVTALIQTTEEKLGAQKSGRMLVDNRPETDSESAYNK
jgi:NADH-quinone oxidoreductase subunit M